MNFYQDIIDRLYVWNTTKGDTNFADPYAFIEAKHFESNDKDFIFYERLLHEMPNHFDPMMRSDLLKEIILYCNRKIDSYKSDYEQPDFIYSITGEPLFFEIKNDKVGQALKPNEKCRKEHALDILNYAIVSIEGEVEHPDQNFYDNKFIKAINSTPNKAEEIRYINHHYSRAKKKNVFMRKIDNLFDRTRKYPTDEVLTQDARSILLEWYNSEIEKLFLRTEKIRKEKEGINSATQPNIFCKSMPLNIPIEHFKVFTEKLSKNKNPFLTIEQLNLFIDRAFKGNEKLPKQKFNQMPKGEKLLIQAVFYDFYNTNCFYYFNTMQCQDIFIKLLTDNFEGWDYKNVKANFTPKTKKRI